MSHQHRNRSSRSSNYPSLSTTSSSSPHPHIVALATGCKVHHADNHAASKTCCYLQEDESLVPSSCRSAIESLRKALPKVEQLLNDETATLHMCQFYRQVLDPTITFCPHALHLFRLGVGGSEILPRVTRLLKRVIETTMDHAIILDTCAHLLAAVEPKLQSELVNDLLYLCLDLQEVQQQEEEDDSLDLLPIELLLFPSLQSQQEYPMTIQKRHQIDTLYTAALAILVQFLDLLRKQNDASLDDMAVPFLSTHDLVTDQIALVDVIQANMKGTRRKFAAQLLSHVENDVWVVATLSELIMDYVKEEEDGDDEYANLLVQLLYRHVISSAVNDGPQQRIQSLSVSILGHLMPYLHNDDALSYVVLLALQKIGDDRNLWSPVSLVSHLEKERTGMPAVCLLRSSLHDPIDLERTLGNHSKRPLSDQQGETTSRKRQRTESGYNNTDHREAYHLFTTTTTLTEELARFLNQLPRAAQRLHTDPTVADAVSISNAIRLVVPSLLRRCRSEQPCPLLCQILETCLDSFVAVCQTQSVMVDKHPIRRIVFDCAASMQLLINLSPGANGEGSDGLANKLDTFIEIVRSLYLSTLATATSLSAVVNLSNETMESLSILSQKSGGTAVTLFEGVSVSFFFRPGACPRGVVAQSFEICDKIGNERLQRDRLQVLSQVVNRSSLAPSDNLYVHTFAVSLATPVDHSAPGVRLLRWMSLAWLLQSMDPFDLRNLLSQSDKDSGKRGFEIVAWMAEVSFSDNDWGVRDCTSRMIGTLLSVKEGFPLFACLADKQEWDCLTQSFSASDPFGRKAACTTTIAKLFKEVDRLLHQHCSVPQSQLSFTVASSTRRQEGKAGTSSTTALVVTKTCDNFQLERAAVRTLSSLSTFQRLVHNHESFIFEESLKRLVCLTGAAVGALRLESAGLCFGGLSYLAAKTNVGLLVQRFCLRTFTPALFRDVVLPSSSFLIDESRSALDGIPLSRRERQYQLLCRLAHRFFQSFSSKMVPIDLDFQSINDFVEDCVPFVVSQLVIEQDYDALRLTTGFNHYVQSRLRTSDRKQRRTGYPGSRTDLSADLLVDDIQSALSSSKSRQWHANLEDNTRDLCLAPKFIERILPSLFMKAGKDELTFFTRDVLQRKMPLKQIIDNRETLILKGLVQELGRDAVMTEPAFKAIKTAALARREGSSGLTPKSSDDSRQKKDDLALSVASEWVTSNFMYLLVNVIQTRWSSKSLVDQVQSVRCLSNMLQLLQANESPQYMQHILATVSASIEDTPKKDEEDDGLLGELRLRAVQVLSHFVKLVATENWEVIGQSLTSIVVALIPVLEDGRTIGNSGANGAHDGECKKTAVALLEWLTQGELGKHLTPSFMEVPFLPSTPALDLVRASLRKLGVDFDNLQVGATQGTQYESYCRASLTSDGGSKGSDSGSVGPSARRQAALRKRIRMVCSLLSNENASIRRVALQHLTSLLRANRELYHALVATEGSTSMRNYITVAYPGPGQMRGPVTEILETLLSRCVTEANLDARVQLAECLGEVGAIDYHRLDAQKSQLDGSRTKDVLGEDFQLLRLSSAPWRSRRTRYELHLVTKHLVLALKAAPNSAEQHKICFCIQQLLVLLDRTSQDGKATSGSPREKADDRSERNEEKAPMSPWLVSKLKDAGVFDVVEPFWSTLFRDAPANVRQPPFFEKADSYYEWISHFGRFMIHRTNDGSRSVWAEMFHACRTAVRTNAGLGVTEFLLPILVLDRFCFGNANDERTILQEFRSVLNFESGEEQRMSHTERQKAVNAVFSVLDTLQLWAEEETERSHQTSRNHSSVSNDSRMFGAESQNDDWSQSESLLRIEDLLKGIPLALRAKAAAQIGMNARAVRLLEMAARQSVVDDVFNGSPTEQTCNQFRSRAAGSCPSTELNLMKDVLAALHDYETMSALDDDHIGSDPRVCVKDSIRQKEASGDWEGALQEYERALQLIGPGPDEVSFRQGALRCLLELGYFESVLCQVNGIVRSNDGSDVPRKGFDYAVPLGIEAAWRLGRWDAIDELCNIEPDDSRDADNEYHLSLGQAMLGLKRKNISIVTEQLRKARGAALTVLSSSARESYSRAYDHIVRLQTLHEIEEASSLLCSVEKEKADMGAMSTDLGWERRLKFMSTEGATSIIKTRLALSRLAGDVSHEGSLFLNLGKMARKKGLYSIAASSFAQAEAAFMAIPSAQRDYMATSSLQIQVAKMKHDAGDSSIALKIMGHENIEVWVDYDENTLQEEAIRSVRGALQCFDDVPQSLLLDAFVRRSLQSTRWMFEGSLKGSSEISNRFRVIHKLAPRWEKGHFQYAKFVDSLLEARILALQRRSPEKSLGGEEEVVIRSRCISNDKPCQNYVIKAVEHYTIALELDSKHVYQALPRLLSLWFELTSIRPSGQQATTTAKSSSDIDGLATCQEEANAFMASNFKKIPAQAFYTAMPQLISRVIHDDQETALVVRGILKRVLIKFPAEAMWALGWLRHSKQVGRREVGEAIFSEAISALSKHKTERYGKILVDSKSLFNYLQDIAKHIIKDANATKIGIRPWKGTSDLSDFVPPTQAALSISVNTGDSDRSSKELFPRQVPRMRAFSSEVGVMASKARPKKIKVYVVAAETTIPSKSSRADEKKNDIGEIHFLVKQEARGDLRKDARVQDLNSVINRLLLSTKGDGVRGSRRRLQLRTFAVTCLSEDTGILEWVPNTESLRSLVMKSYNPQASAFCNKRRGRRATNFAEPMLRSNFENKCQGMFFNSGNLKRAAFMFEKLCLQAFPPVLYWWFVRHFNDPHAWYEARLNFTLSAAAWSAVGHVIGLGDRHSENILVDVRSGCCVHVDFDCIFDKGLNLPKPEVVPFRLTQNMMDAFGPTGAEGVYRLSLHTAMATLRNNRDTLLSVLEPFVKDPVIDWRRYRSQQERNPRDAKTTTNQDRQLLEAKRSINVIDERLMGIYNLRNPNLKKIRRTDGIMTVEDEMSHLVPLSVEGQVHKMIAEATSCENLVQLYVGWMPWV